MREYQISSKESATKRAWAGRSLTARLAYLNDLIVPYPDFTRCTTEISRRVRRCIQTGKGESIAVIAETGATKTTIAKHFFRKWPAREMPEFTRHKVVKIDPPSRPSALAMSQLILVQLGDPFALSRKGTKAFDTLLQFLKMCGTRLIIVDNYQDVKERRKESGILEIAGWQRSIIDAIPALFLTLGSAESLNVVKANSQVRRRVPAHLYIDYFDCASTERARVFARTLLEIDKQLPLAEICGLGTGDLTARMFFATKGIFDYIIGILEEAIEIVVQNGRERIEQQDLAAAFLRYFKDSAPTVNPFVQGAEVRLLDRVGEPFHRWNEIWSSDDDK